METDYLGKGYWPPCDNEDCQIQAELGGYVWEGRDGLPAWNAADLNRGVQCVFCGKTLKDFYDDKR